MRLEDGLTPAALPAVGELFREYAASLGLSLAYQDFETELSDLAAKYGPACGGALLLLRVDGVPGGTIALRRLEPAGVGEVKRLYVRPAFRGGPGRVLVEGVLEAARALGYARLRLDTIDGQMDAAVRLYRSVGFRPIPAYYPSPVPGTLYFELTL